MKWGSTARPPASSLFSFPFLLTLLFSIKLIRSIIINTSKLKYSPISILSKHSSITLILTFTRSININYMISISISYTIGIIIKLMNSFSTPNIIFNINYSSSSNKFNNIISSFDTIYFTMNSISYNINSSYTKRFISFSKSFFDSKTMLNGSIRLSILTRSINNSVNNFSNSICVGVSDKSLYSIYLSYFVNLKDYTTTTINRNFHVTINIIIKFTKSIKITKKNIIMINNNNMFFYW